MALVWLPAIGTLYYALGQIWNLTNPVNVVGTIMAVDAFLGVVLHISSSNYTPPTDGHLMIDKSDPVKDTYTLDLSSTLHDIENKSHILLAVKPKEGAK